MASHAPAHAVERSVEVQFGMITLKGDLVVPEDARGIVLFAHGSGSSRLSPRNRFVAERLHDAELATLLIDLLTIEEEIADDRTGQLRFNIGLLADRLVGATDWMNEQSEVAGLPLGYFGASTGGGAALVAATKRAGRIAAVVSRGGRPDLARGALREVRAATLLIVGGDDDVVIELNEAALRELAAPVKELVIVPGASHLFEEPGKLEEVARLSAEWFRRHFAGVAGRTSP
jgi:putative phosphoribosyl transferase